MSSRTGDQTTSRISSQISYVERVNVERAKKLLGIPKDVFEKFIWEDKEENGNKGMDRDTYIFVVKKFLKVVVKNNGVIEQNYEYSKNMKDAGRIFVQGFGVQGLKKKLRGYLCCDYYHDFDMINAHPTILLYMCEKHFPDDEFPYLEKYVKDRDNILKKYEIKKEDVLISLNSNEKTRSEIPFLVKLDREFKRIQRMFYDELPNEISEYAKYKKDKKKNCRGSFLNSLMTIYENQILIKAMTIFNEKDVGVPCFDGALVSNKLDIEKCISDLNKKTKKYGVTWSNKKHDTYIEENIDDLEYEEELGMSYDDVKIRFEKEYFVVERPFTFCRVMPTKDNDVFYMIPKASFKDLTAPWTFEEIQEVKKRDKVDSKVVIKDFSTYWMKDPKRRSYQSIDFIPAKTNDDKVFNTFTGFSHLRFESDGSNGKDYVKKFVDHVKLLTDFHEESTEYLLNYLAHSLQKTTELPQSVIVIKSREGMGKDCLLDFMARILGNEFFLRTSNLEEVFGQFNSGMRNNIFLQLNEVGEKDGFLRQNRIKDLSTVKFNNINTKGLPSYSQTNYTRMFIFSNDMNPIAMPKDGRRYVVFQPTRPRPSREYFNDLYEIINDDSKMYHIAQFLLNRDISSFDPKNRVITKAYEEMRTDNIDPVFYFMKEFLITNFDLNIKNESLILHNEDVIFSKSKFKDEYDKYLEEQNIENCKTGLKHLAKIFMEMGITPKQCKIKGSNIRCGSVNFESIKVNLSSIIKDEIIEEL